MFRVLEFRAKPERRKSTGFYSILFRLRVRIKALRV
jgi:hypothetical protein